MPYDLQNKLVIEAFSRELFDLEAESKVYVKKKINIYQVEHENELFRKGD